MSVCYNRDGAVIVESNRAILNVKHMSDGTDRLEGIFDLDNRRCYMFAKEELGRDVFIVIDNREDGYADTWRDDTSYRLHTSRYPSNYVLHDYAKHHDLKLSIKFMSKCRSELYADIIEVNLSSRYDGYTKIITREYDGGIESRISWYWRESDYSWLTSDATKIDYTQFSKALETMPDFLKKPYSKSNNMKEAFKMEYKYHRVPQIKNVIIAEPYTTILWSDNTKTQVKCMDGDRFDPEHGFAMCVLKKIYEEPKKPNAYSKWLKGWVKKGVENGEKQKKKKQKKEKEECEECCDPSSFFSFFLARKEVR